MLDVYNILPHVTTLPLPFRIVGHIFRIIWMVLTTLYAIPPYLGWTFIVFPVRYFHWELFWTIEGFLFTGLLAIIGSWLITGQYKSKIIFNLKFLFLHFKLVFILIFIFHIKLYLLQFYFSEYFYLIIFLLLYYIHLPKRLFIFTSILCIFLSNVLHTFKYNNF